MCFRRCEKKLTWTLHVLCLFFFNAMVLVDLQLGSFHGLFLEKHLI